MSKPNNTRKLIIAAMILSLALCLVLIPSLVYARATTGEPITFDLARGNVEIGVLSGTDYIYQGYDSAGTLVTGIHDDSNKYLVMQTDSTTVTDNRIILTGYSGVPVFDVTISDINCATSANKTSGGISVSALATTPMSVILRLEGENRVGRVHYATGEAAQTSVSSLLITSADGDGSTAGTLYAYSRVSWSAAIGGIDDATEEASRNITIAGGTIYAEVEAAATSATGTSAIGGGGNGVSDVTITGGIVNAENSGTGATIGGGGGQGLSGAEGYVDITGGVVNAVNAYEHGVAIGGGGSINSLGMGTTVTISGGTVTTTGSIGGGYSLDSSGGNATVTISGGVVNVTGSLGISGGSTGTDSGTPGTATVTISGGTVTANTISGGTSASTGTTAAGTLNVTGGSVQVAEIPPTTSTTNGTDSLVMKTITVSGISAVTLITNVQIIRADDSLYDYGSDMYTDETGKLYLWVPTDCTVEMVTASVNGEPNNATVTDVSPTFIIIIPDTVNITGSSGSFTLEGIRSYQLPSDSLTVTVSTTSGFELVGAQSNQSLTYELRSQSASGTVIASGDIVATYVGNGTDTTTIYYSIIDTPIYADTYTDTLTFTVTFNDGT